LTLGLVLNKDDVKDKVSGPVAASTTLNPGLVYEDGANGWKQAPTTGAAIGNEVYWNPVTIDNSSGALGDKVGEFYGEGARVVGQADGAIPVDGRVKPSTTASHEGQFIAGVITAIADLEDLCGTYKGHYLTEINQVGVSRTAAADAETDCVFELRRAI